MILRSLLTLSILLATQSLFAKEECGTKGSVEERIQDCSYEQKEFFILVARVKYLKQIFRVYKDIRTNLLWSESLYPNQLNYPNAMNACEFYIRKEMANISDVTWKLPSLEMYKEAERSGIKTALPNMDGFFWTSTEKRGDTIRAYMFNGVYGDISTYNKENGSARVRCVAQTY